MLSSSMSPRSAAITTAKCRKIDAAMITSSRGSKRSASVPRTDAGSIGLGWRGGSATNWNSTVRSPSESLPRELSPSATCQ